MFPSDPYSGFPIEPTKSSPILLAEVLHRDGFYLRGVFFIGETIIGYESRQAPTLDESLLCEGAFVIDGSKLPRIQSLATVCGPQPDVRLPPMTIERGLNIRTTFASLSEAVEDERFMRLTTLISTDLYAHMWRMLGAKIGRKLAGRMIWDLDQMKGVA